jgi:type VI secretion system secreted protein VgrG
MSNLKIAVDFVLKQEDSRLLGNVTTIRGDRGGPTRFGLASASHPELVSEGYYDPARVSRDAALATAEQVYGQTYATPLHIAEIDDQAVATAILSLGVNAWVKRPAQFIQEACVQLGQNISVDGEIGPGTLAAINSCDPEALLAAFCDRVRSFYRELARTNANDAVDLSGWLNRVNAWQTNAAVLRAQAA